MKLKKEKYLELKYFCLQYKDMTKATGVCGRTARSSKVNAAIIEHIAEQVAPDIKTYLLENVTTGKSWEKLRPPCGRRQFYAKREDFFVELSKIR